MMDAEFILIVVIWVTCLHESLHILGFMLLKIKYKVTIIKKWHIPIAISLDPPVETDGQIVGIAEWKRAWQEAKLG